MFGFAAYVKLLFCHFKARVSSFSQLKEVMCFRRAFVNPRPLNSRGAGF
jgi:hypothetical protein